jgi:hypothetical protein
VDDGGLSRWCERRWKTRRGAVEKRSARVVQITSRTGLRRRSLWWTLSQPHDAGASRRAVGRSRCQSPRFDDGRGGLDDRRPDECDRDADPRLQDGVPLLASVTGSPTRRSSRLEPRATWICCTGLPIHAERKSPLQPSTRDQRPPAVGGLEAPQTAIVGILEVSVNGAAGLPAPTA